MLDEGLKGGRLDVDGERRLANITPLTPPPPHVLNIGNVLEGLELIFQSIIKVLSGI